MKQSRTKWIRLGEDRVEVGQDGVEVGQDGVKQADKGEQGMTR